LNELFDEICGNCGLTRGSHHSGLAGSYPYNYCPKNEGQMDYEEGKGTYFKATGKYKEKIL